VSASAAPRHALPSSGSSSCPAAVAEAVEPFPGDGSEDPAPYCEVCGGDIGVFLKLGLDWRHYIGTDLSDIELTDPGHAPVLAWRIPGPPA